MNQQGQTEEELPLLGSVAGTAAALIFAAIWVGLTLRTGVTYHLFPLAIAALPALVAYRVFESRAKAPPLVAAGLLIVAAAWGVLELAGEAPTTTFVKDQPGGVPGEVAVLALLGGLVGLLLSRGRG